MIKLPDFAKAMDYENDFYLSCDVSRISKLIAHYELYRMVNELPGAIVECGVFKGASLLRFAMFRELLHNSLSRKIIGFDVFGEFPTTSYASDQKFRNYFVEVAGSESISKSQLEEVLKNKRVDRNCELIEGDITLTVPEYVRQNPQLKIALINLDTDIYEPAVTILEFLWPRLVRGGLLVLDDYGVFPGETKAVDDFFKNMNIVVHKFPFALTPCYIIKM